MSLSSLDEVTAIAVSWAMGFFESCWTLQKIGSRGSVVYCYIGSITSIWKVVYYIGISVSSWCFSYESILSAVDGLTALSQLQSIMICISVGSYPEDIDVFHVFWVSLFFYNFYIDRLDLLVSPGFFGSFTADVGLSRWHRATFEGA